MVELDDFVTGIGRGNSILSNGKLGIDLGNDGLTLPGTPPTFPNGGISLPTLTQAIAGNSTRIVGTFHGAASTTILIDVYVSLVADPSGYGEGQRYLGTITVITNASGDATFDSIIPAKIAKGSFVTATATDAAGNSSEFGQSVIAL